LKTEFATFGGGCFWGVEKFLQETSGVIDAVSGYAGGHSINPTYSDVCGGYTGHAEVVNVEFNPAKIKFETLVKIFLKTYRDTNEINRETKSQYRSIILYRNEDQKKSIEKVFNDFEQENNKIITTQVKALDKFYRAEESHQDYYGSCRTEV